MAHGPVFPKEHGAYGQLGLPLAAALCMGRPGLDSLCLAVAAAAAFFAHEPAAVLMGKRGVRLRRTHSREAGVSLALWGACALAFGALGLALGGRPVILAAAIPAGLALALTPLLFLGKEKSPPGEMLAAAALSGASLPVVVSTGRTLETGLWVWLAWIMGFWASTFAVHRVIAVHKKQPAGANLALLILATLAMATRIPQEPVLTASIPYLLAAWTLVLRPPSPRHLRRVGWALMAAGVLAAATAVIVVRRSGYA